MAEREQQITSIFHSAIGREPHERAPYLDGACGNDEALRREVEELIRSHEGAGSFIDSPAYERGAELLEDDVPRTRAGQSIGPYKIVSLIGAGGMGEVYRANDSRLGREVALKLLQASSATGTESVRRFQQEARAASALNHPNILSIYDIGDYEDSPYIVSELLAGETLREKLSGVPLPARKALDYALQAARGLAAAHEKGIVHRDLKPENLFITKDGRVKILDFGIAKLVEQKPGALHTEAPTLLVKTDPGMVIGTAGYMSPEQVRGDTVDHRSDIFSFGAIFYEMLSGKRAFRGESHIETLNAILKEEPPELATTNSQVAPEIARVVRRCLEKQPEERFQSASDLAFAIESLSGTQVSGSTNAVAAANTSATKGLRRVIGARLGWIVAAVLLLATIAFAALYFRRTAPGLPTVRFTLPAPEKSTFRGDLALSPDGRQLAFAVEGNGSRSLWVRALDSVEARELPGTAEASFPFWSPDGRFIGFFAGNKLKKIDTAGGPPQALAEVNVDARGGTWAPDGTIIFTPAPEAALLKVSAAGGPVEPVTELDSSLDQTSHRWPYFLPDGRHFLYYSRSKRKEASGIYVGSLDTKERKFLFNTPVRAAFAPAADTAIGYLLFIRDQRLLAQPFDARRLELSGEPTVIAEGILNFPEDGGPTAYAAFSASPSGNLAYLQGGSTNTQLGWFDREGKPLGLLGSPGQNAEAWLSPDGKRVALGHADSQQSWDIWLVELVHGTTTRFTFDPAADVGPLWSRDGNRIFFASTRNSGSFNLYQKLANGASGDELLLKTEFNSYPDDCVAGPAGELLLYESDNPKTRFDLWLLPLTGERKPYTFLQTEFNETHAQFSPDGRFIAYVSDESGSAEVYVQNFPISGGKWQISTGGGNGPQWRRDGRELFYMAPDKTLMAVPITTGDGFAYGSPQKLFATHVPPGGVTDDRSHFDASPDGQRFLVNNLLEEDNTRPITVVLNWATALKQ